MSSVFYLKLEKLFEFSGLIKNFLFHKWNLPYPRHQSCNSRIQCIGIDRKFSEPCLKAAHGWNRAQRRRFSDTGPCVRRVRSPCEASNKEGTANGSMSSERTLEEYKRVYLVLTQFLLLIFSKSYDSLFFGNLAFLYIYKISLILLNIFLKAEAKLH